MRIALVGLGKMGKQIVQKLVDDGHSVIAFDRDPNQATGLAPGVVVATSREDVLAKFGSDSPVIWLMIPQEFVDAELQEWQKLLHPGTIVIDGGNSRFSDTARRHDALAGSKIEFVDVGTSGGVLGAQNGFSLMIGGDENIVSGLDEIFRSLVVPNGAYEYLGPSGSGHFVKMVHNAIEYGYMESLAEGYQLLAEGPYQNLNLSRVAGVWQHGSIVQSSLNELAGEVLEANPRLGGISGVVDATGEASWALDEAAKHSIEMPAVAAAVEVRAQSQRGTRTFATKLLAAIRNKFGGHDSNPK